MTCLILLLSVLVATATATATETPGLAQEVEGLLRVVSRTGHESSALRYMRERLGELPSSQDALGNLTVAIGSGNPRRLVACTLDQPGYVVSRVQEDGYLRLSRVGRGLSSPLWDQSHEGQKVVVVTEQGLIPGAVGVKSVHLAPAEANSERPFRVDQAYVDVGVETAAEVGELGIRLLHPVALMPRLAWLSNGLLAAPSARAKAACIAMVRAARRVVGSAGRGTTVFAWTVLGHMGRRGLEGVARQHGPFDEVLLLSAGFGWQRLQDAWLPSALPAPGAGVLGAGELPVALPPTTATPHVVSPANLYTGDPKWGAARIGYLGLPARFLGTPVELIDLSDLARLEDALVIVAGGTLAAPVSAPALSAPARIVESQEGHGETLQVLAALVSRYGVSGAEGPVRDQIRALLPRWAQVRTDAQGNLLVTAGSGAEHVVFVAHMDEVGFQIVSLFDDGRLLVRPRGGLDLSLWEAQAGLVHTAEGAVPAVFEARQNWFTAQRRAPSGALSVFVGATSRQEAQALGIRVGQTVSMPKRMVRLGTHRVMARSLDDRVGSAVLLLALRHIDVQALRQRLTFAWVVEEEIGFGGSRSLTRALSDVTRVYPVDTFVSSDAPLESQRFAFAPLGQGAVVRAMDSGNIVPRGVIDEILRLAHTNSIPLQYGMTAGWSDGTPFLAHGMIPVPLSWPGRYSHSPVEVADLRDIEALTRLIVAIALQ